MISVEELTKIFRLEVIENPNCRFINEFDQIICRFNDTSFLVKHEKCKLIDLLCGAYICHHVDNINLDNFPKSVQCVTLDFGYNKIRCLKNFPHITQDLKNLNFSDCHFLEDYSPLSNINVVVHSLRFCDTLFNNFEHLPRNVGVLNIEKCYRLRSFEGIEKINGLHCLIVYDLSYCKNILNLLECKRLNTIFGAEKGSQFAPIIKYIKLPDKHEYMMDCTIDLINAGFERCL